MATARARGREARWGALVSARRPHVFAAGALTVFLAFRAGGFFPGVTGLVAARVAVALMLRVTAAPHPWDGVTPAFLVSAAGFVGLLTWILLSAGWSDASMRALIEFDRALLYLLVVVLFGLVARRHGDLTRVLRWTGLAIAAVGTIALLTRLLPDQLPTRRSGVYAERLDFPLTYWNALGVLAAVGTVLAVRASASPGEPRWSRLLGTAALPILAVTLYFTFSRGAILAVALGVTLLVLLGPTRGLLTTALAAVPTTGLALWVAYRSDLLAGRGFDSPAARPDAHRLLAVIVATALAAAGAKALMATLDRRLALRRLPAVTARRVLGLAAALLVLAAVGTIASGLPSRLDRGDPNADRDLRNRLTKVGDPGREAHWNVALDEFRRDPWRGSGAGTYRLVWERERPIKFDVNEGHSLYLETLAELGVPGLLFVLVLLVPPLAIATTRLGGDERHAHAAYLAAGLALVAHAGVDWDWENPALFVWFFAASGVVLAAPARPPTRPAAARLPRLVTGLACLFLAITPALVAASQSFLNRSVHAFDRGDCTTAIDAALDSTNALGVRADPFEILAYCDARARRFRLGLGAMEAARRRDPDNWQLSYGLAVMQGLAGVDPRPAAALALRENPLEELTLGLDRRLRRAGSDRRGWFRIAARADIPRR